MNENNRHNKLTDSFKYALKGLKVSFMNEKTFQVQIFAAFLAVIGGFVFNISALEWIVVIITISLVLSLELINTQIERLIDYLHPERHPEIGKIKDVMAAAVLISSIAALIIASVVFLPKFLYI